MHCIMVGSTLEQPYFSEVDTCHMPINLIKTFATNPKAHKDGPELNGQRFTRSYSICLSSPMDG